MPFTRLRYHFTTATKERKPLITAEVEPIIHLAMCERAVELGGVIMEINGTEDHQHFIAAVPPTIAIKTFVGQLKAESSKRVNASGIVDEKFQWQVGYGGFTLNPARLDEIFAYVREQKIRHRTGDLMPAYERVARDSKTF